MVGTDTQEARQKILKFLEERDYTQSALAEMFQIPATQLSQYLNGKDTGPKAYDTLLRILSRFDIK